VEGTWLPLLPALAFFLTVHALALRLEPRYPRAFKLSRGVAAAVLTAIGLAALISAGSHWDRAFLYRHEPGDWMRTGLLVVYGHLLSDFAWMAWGRLRHGIHPRKDLLIHHALGVLAYGVALLLHVGYALALIAMITEILPVTTGLHAVGQLFHAPVLTGAMERARLHILTWVRLPLWILLLLLDAGILVLGRGGELVAAHAVAAGGLAGLVALDIYWIGKCRERVDFY